MSEDVIDDWKHQRAQQNRTPRFYGQCLLVAGDALARELEKVRAENKRLRLREASRTASEYEGGRAFRAELEKVRAERDALRARVGGARWITVTETLPAEGQHVLAYSDREGIVVASFYGYSGVPPDWHNEGGERITVTQWMALPEPPTAERPSDPKKPA